MRRRPSPRVAVVTGASSGIGLATALLFARNGWRVGLIARSAAGLADAECRIIEMGGRACHAVADVTDAAALDAAAARISATLGAIAVWVNVAGNGVFGPFADVPAGAFDRVTATTYTGTVNGVRTALSHMQPGNRGAIVNVCSAVAFRGLPGLSSYAGAKAAVRGFTESVQTELKLAGSRIRLSIIYPPAVNTPFFAHAASYMRLPPRPAKPVYQPELIAEGILLAAITGRQSLKISFVTVIFDLACRLVPGLIRRAMERLGYDGQMTDLPEALALRDPCLFDPPLRLAGVRGPFPARGHSTQLWLTRHRAGLMAAAGLAAGSALAAAGLRLRHQGLGHRPDPGGEG